jgi:hypothetical protein
MNINQAHRRNSNGLPAPSASLFHTDFSTPPKQTWASPKLNREPQSRPAKTCRAQSRRAPARAIERQRPIEFLKDESAATAIEYGVIAAGMLKKKAQLIFTVNLDG